MVNYNSPYAPKTMSVLKPRLNPLTSTIPGVGVTGKRGPVVRPEVAEQSNIREREEAVSPLQTFQSKLREQIQQGEQHTNSIRSRYGNSVTARKHQMKLAQQGWAQPRQRQQSSANTYSGPKSTSSWGGYANGRIPPEKLQRLSFAGGHMARPDAANAMERLNAAYKQVFGTNIGMTDSYRSLQGQINVARSKPGFAAKPGTSVHGLGAAFDLAGPAAKHGSRENKWLQQNAGQFGIGWPKWARNPKRFEPWHWEFMG